VVIPPPVGSADGRLSGKVQRDVDSLSQPSGGGGAPAPKMTVKDLTLYFSDTRALQRVNLTIMQNEILGVIGPANSGKTSFLRALNRMNDLNPECRHSGTVELDGADIYTARDVSDIRRRVGMVFALPNPLPMSIADNVLYGPRLHRRISTATAAAIVQRSLRAASLWDEVQNRLTSSAMQLSGGQQQRLCIARTLALEPEVILFDEPCSGLDPISTAKVEEAMVQLKKQYTIVLVTNNTKQAARVADRTAYFLTGELVELDKTERLFTTPRDMRTEDYISGRVG
jgi:phosphate transport system ATP-binding protein